MPIDISPCSDKFKEAAGTSIDPALKQSVIELARKAANTGFLSKDAALRKAFQAAIEEHKMGTAEMIRKEILHQRAMANFMEVFHSIRRGLRRPKAWMKVAYDALVGGNFDSTAAQRSGLEVERAYAVHAATQRVINLAQDYNPFTNPTYDRAMAEAVYEAQGLKDPTPNLSKYTDFEQQKIRSAAKEWVDIKKNAVDYHNANGGMIVWRPDHVATFRFNTQRLLHASITSDLGKLANFFVEREGGTDADRNKFVADALRHWDFLEMQLEINADPKRANDPTKIGFDPKERNAFIRQVYDDAASGKRGNPTDSFSDDNLSLRPDRISGVNPGAAFEHSSFIRFKSAADYADFNQKYGAGTLVNAMMNQSRGMANSTAIMRRGGSDLMRLVREVTQEITALQSHDESISIGKRNAFEAQNLNEAAKLEDAAKAILGTDVGPVNSLAWRMARGWADQQFLSSLGTSFFPHLMAAPATLFKMGDDGFRGFSQLLSPLTFAIRSMTDSDLKDFSRRTSVFNMSTAMEIQQLGRFAEGGNYNPAGWLTAMKRLMVKGNLMQWYNETFRNAVKNSYSHEFAWNAGKSFEALPEKMQRLLNQYRITPEHWDSIRQDGVVKISHWDFLDTDYHRGKKFADNPAARANAREASTRFEQLFHDVSNQVFATPDLRSDQRMLLGNILAKDNPLSIFPNMFMKTQAAVLQRVVMPAFNQRGPGMAGAARFATFLAGMSATGCFVNAGKQLAQGRNPLEFADLSNDMTPEERFHAATMFYVDSLPFTGVLGQFSGLLGLRALSMSHRGPELPQMGGIMMENMSEMTRAIADHAMGKDKSGELAKAIEKQLPYQNMLFLRPIINYLALYGFHEHMNPGYIHHIETLARQQGSPYMFPPSEYANRWDSQ